jgi:hypothetical protein
MKTFNKELKKHWINLMQSHQDAGRLLQTEQESDDYHTYYDKEKLLSGSFFTCAMQTADDAAGKAVKKMKLPHWIVYLAEEIFDGLHQNVAMFFPVQLLKAIPVNTDIKEAMHKVAVKRLESLIEKSYGDELNNAIQQVVDYHKNPDRTEEDAEVARLTACTAGSKASLSASAVRKQAYQEAFNAAVAEGYQEDEAAYKATLYASATADYQAARSAARSAYTAALSSTYQAARSAARSAAYSATDSATWQKERDNLISALKEL